MPAPTPEARSLVGRIASNERWSRCVDRSAATAPARRAMLARFEREVDPDNQLEPAERARRAEHKRKAYFQRLALKSAQSRRKALELTAVAEAAETELRAEVGGPDATPDARQARPRRGAGGAASVVEDDRTSVEPVGPNGCDRCSRAVDGWSA